MNLWKHAALLILVLLVLSPIVPAQEAEPKDPPPANRTITDPPEIDIMKVSPAELVGADVSVAVSRAQEAYNGKRYEEAAKCYIWALRQNPGDSTALYNLACCYGLLGAHEQAAKFLRAAYSAGFRDLAHIRRDPDFDKIRETDSFEKVLQELGARAEKERAERGELIFVESTRLLPVRVVKPADGTPFERLPLVIGLHGLGDNAENFVSLFKRRGIEGRFLFAVPDGPYPFPAGSRGVGFNWFLRPPRGQNAVGLRAHAMNVQFVLDVLEAVKKHHMVDERKVFLMGFSQGAGMTFSVGLTRPDLFRGLIPVGGWPQPGEHGEANLAAAAKHTRFLICHSPEDRVVTFDNAERAEKLLSDAGIANELVEYAGGHTLTKDLLQQIATWVEQP
jgi:phospholipase/carboxylesterase